METLHTQPDDPEVFLTFTSFLTRPAPYRLDVNGGGLEPLSTEIPAFDASKCRKGRTPWNRARWCPAGCCS
ncbi:hypothetical protein CTI14_45455 [Methylobacterium radiotolerans]|nr:hypothetical protein CTI14_45455 [Methylobacterium radiotolerans]